MTIDLSGKVAIVTGAGTGIGREIARELGRRGASVLVNDYGGDFRGNSGSVRSAQAVAEEIGEGAFADETAVGTAGAAAAIVAKAVERFGGVDILVNNAGVTLPAPIDTPDLAGIERIIDVNLWGAYHLIRAVWPVMRRRGGGHVLNIASNAVIGGYGNVSAYAASKGGVVGLTVDAAAEGRPDRILVNALIPVAYTRLAGGDITGPSGPFSRWLKAHFPPASIAPAAAYFVSPANADVSGELFCVAGGRVSRLLFANNDGYFDPALSAESIAANIDRIRDVGTIVPVTSGAEETARYMAYHPFEPEGIGGIAATADDIDRNSQ